MSHRSLLLSLILALSGITLLISPLLEASWDIWSKTIIHLISTAAFTFLLFYKYHEKKEFLLPGSFSLMLFFAFVLLSVLNSKIPFQSKIEWHNYLNYIIFILLAVNLFEGKDDNLLEKASPYIAASIFAMTLLGIYQKYYLHSESVYSSMINANIFAGYLILSLPLLISKFKNPFYGIAVLAGLISLLLTKSFAGIFGLACAFFIVRLGILRGSIISLLAGTVYLLFNLNSAALSDRIMWWKSAITIIYQNPVFGSGPGTFELIYPSVKTAGQSSLYAHNYFLQLCSESGIPALIFAAIFFTRRTFSNSPACLRISLIAVLIQNFFDYNLIILANGLLFWTILGTLCAGQLKSFKIKTTAAFIVFIMLSSLYFASSFGKLYFAVVNYNKGINFLSENNIVSAEISFKNAISSEPDMWLVNGKLAEINMMKFRQTGRRDFLLKSGIELQRGIYNNPYYPFNRGMLRELNKTIVGLK